MTSALVLSVTCFVSEGFSCYLAALIEVYHNLKTLPRTGKPGRPKQPLKEPHPELVYGQVIKKTQKGRLQELVYRSPLRCQALGGPGAVDQHQCAGASHPHPASCFGAAGAQERELL